MRYEMKPRTSTELIDAGFQLYRNHFGKFIGLAAMTQGAASVVELALFRVFAGTWGMPDAHAMEQHAADMVPCWLLYGLVAFLGYTAVQTSMVYAASEAYHGRAPEPRAALMAALPRMPSAAGASILCGIGTTLGFLCFLVPGVLMTLNWAITGQVVVLEDVGARGALNRSKALIKDERGRIGTLLFLVMLMVLCITIGITGGFALALKQTPFILALLQVLPVLLTAPVHGIIMTLAYYDLRIRKEAYDLEAAAGDVAVGTAALPPT